MVEVVLGGERQQDRKVLVDGLPLSMGKKTSLMGGRCSIGAPGVSNGAM